jgi:hypothetical protein
MIRGVNVCEAVSGVSEWCSMVADGDGMRVCVSSVIQAADQTVYRGELLYRIDVLFQ